MPPASIRSAALSATPGRNGTADSATTSARFVKGDDGTVRTLAYRLTGSPDVYGHEEREPEQSINFVTCHDGFTLNDLVSYNVKHNEANGEGNRDGTDDNRSWNCGVEGPTDDPAIEAVAQPPGEEFPRADAARGRHADAADGRRGAAYPARQQQRVLPRRRDDLVRLDAARTPRRRVAVHARTDRVPAEPALADRTRAD